jgi:hypothetical protein
MSLNHYQLNLIDYLKVKKHELFIIFLLVTLITSQHCYAEENQQQTSSNAKNQTNNSATIHWPTDQESLSKNNDASESIWIDMENSKVLTLKYNAKGRKFHGNIIFLHAQGENASHPRLSKPFALQLSQLGWEVFVPNLPSEDFYESSKRSLITGSSRTTDSSYKAYFKDLKAYQGYINNLVGKISGLIQKKNNNFVLIGNQNGAYWLLESSKSLSDIKQVVLLDPQKPITLKNDIKINFEEQFLPVYTFVENNNVSNEYINAFEKQQWRSTMQRLNRGLVSKSGIELEDNRVAKLITGWIISMQKSLSK